MLTLGGHKVERNRMLTAHIHAKLIAAFLGDDEPCYGQCQCVSCRASFPTLSLKGDRVRDYPGVR